MKTGLPFVLLLMLGCSHAGRNDEDVDALIEDLVIAPSREAIEAATPSEVAARNERALKSLERLQSLGWRAFPRLVAHSQDQRLGLDLRVRNYPPLGVTCFDILEEQVIPEMTPTRWFTYSFLDWSLIPEWWKERSGLTLREVQVEAALFALALAEWDKDPWAKSFDRRVKELGVADPESAMKQFRIAFARLSLPDSPDELITTFKLPPGTYLERRVALERSNRAWDRLQKLGLAAFPELLRHLEDPATGDDCFRLIQRSLLDNYHEGHPELTLLTKTTVTSWLKERSGRTLKELRIEIVHHCIDTARKSTYKNQEEKDSLLEFLNEHLDRIQKE